MTRQIDIGGRQGRGNPETRPAPLKCNRLDDDGRLIDPDAGWQDSAAAQMYAAEPPEPAVGDATWSEIAFVVVAALLSAGLMLALGWHLWSQP